MYEPHAARILAELRPEDIVLDVGGWACPFNRANYVVDAGPYESRGAYAKWGGAASQGGELEHFTPDTWFVRDLCDRVPLPFASKSIDFAICSHTLEDLRDPLWVCSELIRVAKRGYIEVPSRVAETSRGWEHRHMAGLSHHRWLIEIEGSQIRFMMKYHMIHRWRYSFPPSYLAALPADQQIAWLFWKDGFTFAEPLLHDLELARNLEDFVHARHPHSDALLRLDAFLDRTRARAGNARNRLRRLVGGTR